MIQYFATSLGLEGWVRGKISTNCVRMKRRWVITLHYSLLHSYVRLGRFEVESGVSFSYLQHVTRQDFWVVKGGHHVFDGSHHYSGVTIASVYVGYYNASKFGEATF